MMDFSLTDLQGQIVAAAVSLLERHAGPDRARKLGERSTHDEQLERALDESGFGAAFSNDDAGPVVAGLIVEACARHVGVVPTIGRLLVGPAVLGDSEVGSLALVDESGSLVRYASPGPALILAGEDAVLVELTEEHVTPVPSPYGFPVARVSIPVDGEVLPGAADLALNWWRVGLALEIAGNLRGALDAATTAVKDREQFGLPIGSFQAVQHRLAHTAIRVEAAHWLAVEAAWAGAPRTLASTAASFTSSAASMAFRNTHQVHGAMGFTTEADLHLWTMRLHGLRLELGGPEHHRRFSGAAWLASRRNLVES